ncbi:MAG: protein kinase [Deltaproteobacteria bacterium]|nr:protein kinase [Deltaproteobacteria bacterium]
MAERRPVDASAQVSPKGRGSSDTAQAGSNSSPESIRDDHPGLPERYHVVRPLGRGLQKQVLLAEDALLNRLVAVAAIDTRGAPELDPELLHEARAMARVGDCPHTVSIYDVIERPDTVYIVGQYLAGGDLETYLRSAKPPLRLCIEIAAQVCQALESVHTNNIAHCDLKPGNIFFDERGDAYLGDFGFSRVMGESTASSEENIVGTPHYMAPELISGTPARPGADLYALGCLIYELTTGDPPFLADTPQEILRLHREARPVAPLKHNPALPPVLNDLILKLLEKRPDDRPSSTRDVRAALEGILSGGLLSGAPETRGASSSRDRASESGAVPELGRYRDEAAIVGRDREIAAFDRAIARALQGESHLILVPGESGIGKSRLLRELRSRVEAAGGISLFGQGYEDARLPYRPFVEALLPLTGRVSELAPEHAHRLRELLYLGEREQAPETPSEQDAYRHRLYLAVLSALGSWSRPRCLALVIDDLHWADSASFDLFEHLAFGLAQAASRRDIPVILAAGFRPGEPRERLARAMLRLEREGICEYVRPAGLDGVGIYDLLVGLGVARPSEQLVQMIREATDGNPLFVREVLACLERQGALHEQRGSLVSSVTASELEMTSSLANAIAERPQDLSDRCRQLLLLASVIGSRFDLRALAAIAPHSEDELVEILEEAVVQQLLIDEGQTYHFAHPMVRKVFYDEPSTSRRQRIHLNIAKRLESLPEKQPNARVIEIAGHLVRAGPLADAATVARFTARAADLALAQFAWHEASQLLEDAISAGHDTLSTRDLAELHLKAGLAHYGNSDAGPCLHHLGSAVEQFRKADDLPGLARALAERERAAMNFGHVPLGELGDVAPVERALEHLDSAEPSLRARVLVTLAQAYWWARRSDKAEELAKTAMDLASAAGDDRLCAELSAQLAMAQFNQMSLSAGIASWRLGVTHARRANDLLLAEKCLHRISLALYLTGSLGDAQQAALEARELNEVVQNPGETTVAFAILVALAVVRGEFDAAEQHAHEGLTLIRRSKFPWSGAMLLPALACGRILRGDRSGAHDALDLMLEPGVVFEDPSFLKATVQPYRQLIDLYVGEPPSADAELGDALPGGAESDSLDPALIPGLCARVEIADAAQAPEMAAGARATIELASRRGLVFSPGWPFLLPRIQGLAATLEGRWDEAEQCFIRATEIADELGATPELARCRLDHARLLALRGGREDRVRAAELLRCALPSLEKLGANAFRDRAEKLMAFLAHDSGDPEPDAGKPRTKN